MFIGILLILGGIFHFIRALDHDEQHRAWIAVAGLLEVVIGVVMIRHLDLTKAAIGLLIGIVWIVQGMVALMAGIMGGSKGQRGWVIGFGLISLVAGIVVVSVPSSSVERPRHAARDLVHHHGDPGAGRRVRPPLRTQEDLGLTAPPASGRHAR